MPCQRDGGSTMNRALPITLSTGTVPFSPPPPCTRESAESIRLSPITHSRPSGTVNGPNGRMSSGPVPGSQ